jgi:hypothetical protein
VIVRRGGRNVALEKERSWRAHDPNQGRVPWRARRQLEVFKRSLLAPAARIEEYVALPNKLLAECLARRGIARQNAVAHLLRTLPGATINAARDVIDIRWLSPGKHLICDTESPSELQDAICVCVALLWRERDGSVTYWANYLLEAPDRATGRSLQHAPNADLAGALYAAAGAFTAADANQVCDCLRQRRSIYLPGGHGGVFAAAPINGKTKDSGRRMLFARARTWLTHRMLATDQQPLEPAAGPAQSVATMLLRLAHEGDPHGHDRDRAALGSAGIRHAALSQGVGAVLAPARASP